MTMIARARAHPPLIAHKILTATVVLLGMITVACSEDPTLAGLVREPPPDVGGIILPDVANDSAPFATAAQEGQILVVYFGYTSCPDICPTTLADLRRAVEELGDDANRIQVAMVTVDPDRDTPDRLSTYVHAFFDGGHALRGEDAAALETAADAFGVSYEVATGEDGTVQVAHSSYLYAIDSSGHITVQWPFGTTSEDMSNDLRKLLRRSP